MAPNDSDSSSTDDEAGDYTETGVLLGYACTDPTDDPISHLGGQPEWLGPSQPASVALARCRVCRDVMRLLLELDGDLPERFPGHRRRLYIFGCARKTCKRKAGSVRAVRGVTVDWKAVAAAAEQANRRRVEDAARAEERKGNRRDLGRELFGQGPVSAESASPNPFAAASVSKQPGASPAAATNPFAALDAPRGLGAKAPQRAATKNEDLPGTFAAKLALDNKNGGNDQASSERPRRPAFEAWPLEKAMPTPYPKYYLDADYETLDASPALAPPSSSSSASKYVIEDEDAPMTNSSSSGGRKDGGHGGKGGGGRDQETFESTLDKTFQRFADRVGQNPLQVLRYEFGGMPLLYSTVDDVAKLFPSHHSSSSSHQHPPHSSARITTTTTSVGGGGGGVQSMMKNRIPACTNCGAPRAFELQIMPHAISELEPDQDLGVGAGAGKGEREGEGAGEEGVLEWGTVILGTCERDCVPAWIMPTRRAEVAGGDDRGGQVGGGGDEEAGGGGGGGGEGEGESGGKERQRGRDGKIEVGYLEEWVGVQWE